jgi:type I restriction enzyme S subunit
MKSEWKTYTVQELIDLGMLEAPMDGNHGNLHPKVSDYVLEGIPFIMANDLVNGKIDYKKCAHITEAQARQLKKGFAHPGDVLLTHKATIGRTALVGNEYDTIVLTPQITYYRVKKGISNRYLKAYFDSKEFQELLSNWAGSGSTRAYLGITAQRKLPILLPSIDIQNKIASYCESIDGKITVNSMINDNLSDLLQTIYQGQFGKVGLANNCGILADICSYSKDKIEISKLSLDTYYSTENMLPEKSGAVKATSLPTTSQTTACHKGDTLISNIRPYFKKIVYCEDDCGCSTDVLCFKPVHPRYTAYLFSTLYADSFFNFMVAGAKGTKMPRGDKQQIMTYPVVLPSEKDLSEFNSVATPILTQIYSNRTESERLSAIRDTLLPKLILGEIDVSSIQL